MDPISTTVALGGAKGLGGAVGKAMAALLGKRTQRFRVAWAVSRAAKGEGIQVSARALSRWLKNPQTQRAISSGDLASVRSVVGLLDSELRVDEHSPDEATDLLVTLVSDETLRRMGDGDARLTQTRRLEFSVWNLSAEQHLLLTSGGDEAAFNDALAKLHPWRAETARQLAERWRPLRAFVITLAQEGNPKDLMQQWGTAVPEGLTSAPAEAWCWLGCVAADYGADESALTFIEKGVAAGASGSYWWARSGLIVGNATPDLSARARELWGRSVPKHPLASAGEAIDDGDFLAAEKLLDSWHPDSANDASIKAILQTVAASGRGDFNRAIVIGLAASAEHPEGSGNALRTAEALLSRGHHGGSNLPSDDFTRAFELAIKARDSRRKWRGDSVAAILTAVKAAALSGDINLAWALTQQAPTGTALAHEVADSRLRREAAIIGAATGRLEAALELAQTLEDPFVEATVRGWKAYDADQPQEAKAAWLGAYSCAPDDVTRLQTASALAHLGLGLPDLGSISDDYSRAVARIRTTHDVLSSDDPLSSLQVRAGESEDLTVLLAERLSADGRTEDAAEVLEAGGNRWSHPLLMRMAAGRYLSAGNYQKAADATTIAMSLGGTDWSGRREALMIRFDALESLGDFKASLAVARQLAALAPENLTARWALVHSLVRAGSLRDAWSALTQQGAPANPRSAPDARTWIGLAAECDDSPHFVSRSLEMMTKWSHDPELSALFLLQIYRGLMRHDRDLPEGDLRELHRVTDEFTTAHPDSRIFRAIPIDENNPLDSLTEVLKQTAQVNPAAVDLGERVGRAELPLALLTEISGLTYLELCIKTGAGLVFSHWPPNAHVGRAAAHAALSSKVIIDLTAASTLSQLDPWAADSLVGEFLGLETTDSAYRDALGAQQSLRLLSTMRIGWDTEQAAPQLTQIPIEQAEGFARRADFVVALLARSGRRGWPILKRFAEFSGDGTWLSALDMAASERRPFWCDDRVLRQLASSMGVQSFGTVELVDALESAGRMTGQLASSVRATLIGSYHVDLPFDLTEVTEAAQLASWMPHGVAATLARVSSWSDPEACIRFTFEAISRVVIAHPDAVAGWTAAAAAGLVRIADGEVAGASENLRILLTLQFGQPWLGPHSLPFVMQGIRAGMAELHGTVDPLEGVLIDTYDLIAARHGAPAAAEFLLRLVGNLDENDKRAAARAILTSQDGSTL